MITIYLYIHTRIREANELMIMMIKFEVVSENDDFNN